MRTFEKIFKGKLSKKNTSLPIPIELRPDSSLTEDEKKYKLAKLYIINASIPASGKSNTLEFEKDILLTRPKIPVANIHSASFQHKQDSSLARLQVISFAVHIGRDTSTQRINAQKIPGKLLAVTQTFDYLKVHPVKYCSVQASVIFHLSWLSEQPACRLPAGILKSICTSMRLSGITNSPSSWIILARIPGFILLPILLIMFTCRYSRNMVLSGFCLS